MAMYEASLPLVTAAPIAGALKLQSLEVRDLSDTCGWVSGISTSSVYCTPGYKCATSATGQAGIVGCAPATATAGYPLVTKCEQYDYIGSTSRNRPSDSGGTLYCAYLSPSCVTWLYDFGQPTPYSAFGCDFGTYGTVKEVSPKLPGSSGPVSPGGTKVDDNWSGNAGQTGGLGQTGSPGQSGNQTPSGGQEPALSTGAIVAIAVCTSIVGLAIIALIFWVLWRRRRSARHAASQPTPLSPENLGHFNDKTDDYVAHMRRISDENPNRPEHSAVGGHDPSVVGYNPSAAGHTTVTNTTWRPQGT